MTSTTHNETVSLAITVDVDVERAFRVFTEQFDLIKPREHNLLAPEPIAETVFEARVGGTCTTAENPAPSAGGRGCSRSTRRGGASSAGTSHPPGSSRQTRPVAARSR